LIHIHILQLAENKISKDFVRLGPTSSGNTTEGPLSLDKFADRQQVQLFMQKHVNLVPRLQIMVVVGAQLQSYLYQMGSPVLLQIL